MSYFYSCAGLGPTIKYIEDCLNSKQSNEYGHTFPYTYRHVEYVCFMVLYHTSDRTV